MQFRVISREEAPVCRARTTPEVAARQALYESFVKTLPAKHIGELELGDEETSRSVKVNLRRTSTRLGLKLVIWDSPSMPRSVFFMPKRSSN